MNTDETALAPVGNTELAAASKAKFRPEIVKNASIILSMDDAERAANAMAASGLFVDSKDAAKAVVKILAGQELGFGPFASMAGIFIIQGKVVMSANIMAAAIKRQGKYNYRIASISDDGCEIIFFEHNQEVGRSSFGKAEATEAGLIGGANWKKYPRNMYFARAISNGQKWYAPDVFNGAVVYTPDELGEAVNDDGAIDFRQDQPAKITEAQINQLDDLIKRTKSDYAAFCKHFGVADIANLQIANFPRAVQMLNQKLAKQSGVQQ